MATLNRIQKIFAKIFTHEGAQAARIDPLAQLERSVMSCLLWESEFYEDGQTIGQRIADLVKVIPAEDVARAAIQAKEDMRLRHVPLLLARELMRTKEGRVLAHDLFPRVILRPDDITEFLAIYWKDNKDEPLAKQVKKWLGDSFRKFDEYRLAKYNGGQKAVKLRDAMRITRPKPANESQAELWRKLVQGELATPDTWEVELSKGGDKKASWTRLLAEDKLGGLAMLRNVRNMTKAGVEPELIRQGIRDVKAGRLLPINFIAAAQHNPRFEPELEAKFFECFAGREKLGGDTIILVDVSGSMVRATVREIRDDPHGCRLLTGDDRARDVRGAARVHLFEQPGRGAWPSRFRPARCGLHISAARRDGTRESCAFAAGLQPVDCDHRRAK